MSFFSKTHTCFLLMRPYHAKIFGEANFKAFEEKYNIKILGSINDFSIRHFFQTYKQYQLLKSIIKTHNIDLLHIMYAEPNALWAYFRNSLNRPIVLTTRGTDVLKTIPAFFDKPGILNKLISYCYRKALQKTDAISCTSYRQKESILRLCAGKAPKIEIVRTGVDCDIVLSDTSAHSVPELKGKKYVFFPRAMRPLYRHEFALSAINLLPAELRAAYRFVFIDKNSSDKAYSSDIAARIEESKADIIWLNNLDQVTLFQTYKGASLVVMTPVSDGTPVSAVETMLCKVPLILPPLLYDSDLFSEGVAYFKTWEAADLAEQMQKILEGTEILDIEKAFENALNLADRNREMTKLTKIYDALCS